MSHDSSFEIEVKFHLREPENLRRRLLGLGAADLGQVFEKNARYEDREGNLKRNGCLLRLRRDGACRLTYKSPPPEASTEFKIYRELEVTVSNAPNMDAILNALGFRAVQTYEKWRQSFTLGEVQVCIDTMPFGCFVEIEGPGVRIKHTAGNLGLDWGERILTNYLAMFQFMREKYQWTFNDVTFDNFASVQFDLTTCLHAFRAAPEPAEQDAPR